MWPRLGPGWEDLQMEKLSKRFSLEKERILGQREKFSLLLCPGYWILCPKYILHSAPQHPPEPSKPPKFSWNDKSWSSLQTEMQGSGGRKGPEPYFNKSHR